jgi:hypothetical protein
VPAVSIIKVQTVYKDMTVQTLKMKKEKLPWKSGNYIIGITSLRTKSSTPLQRNQHAHNSIPHFFKITAYPASMATAHFNPTRRPHYMHRHSIFIIHCSIPPPFFLVFIDNMLHYKVILHVLSFLILNHIIASKIVIWLSWVVLQSSEWCAFVFLYWTT